LTYKRNTLILTLSEKKCLQKYRGRVLQIITDSVLSLIEINDQIGEEIGVKTWLDYRTWDYVNFPRWVIPLWITGETGQKRIAVGESITWKRSTVSEVE
jgi:hypothetical protein